MESNRGSNDGGTSGGDTGPAWGASARERVERGLDRGKEAFAAFREALEETFTDARERGDLTTDRAKELWGRAVDRARDATHDARDRFDFASHAEFEALERRVAALEVLLGVDRPAGPSGAAAPDVTDTRPGNEGGEAPERASEESPDPSATD